MKLRRWSQAALLAAVLLIITPGWGDRAQERGSSVGLSFWAFQDQKILDLLQANDLRLEVDGQPQSIDGLFLIKSGAIARKEGKDDVTPPLAHDYFLLFQVYEYDSQMERVIDFFVMEVLTPADSLIIITPANSFHILPTDLQRQDRKDLASDLKKKFRRDIKSSTVVYRNLIKQLRAMVQNIARSGAGAAAESNMFDTDADNSEADLGIQVNLLRYKETLPQLEKLRLADQERMLGLANVVKNTARQQTVFFIYQKEYRPELDPKISSIIAFNNSDQPSVQADLLEISGFYRRETTYDTPRIRQAFAASGAQFHLVFVNHQVKQITGIVMREQSEDVLRTFSDIAAATGGEAVTSSNSDSVIRKLVEKYSTRYYLTFSPRMALLPGFHRVSLSAGSPDINLECRKGFMK